MGLTLEEAIEHAEEVAEENEKEFGLCPYPSQECNGTQDCRCLENGEGKGCLKCAADHRQLAEWLRELQKRRKQPEIIHCKDCIKGKYHNLAKSTMCMLHPFNPVRVEPDGFCKWAERRTDEQPN